MKKMNAYFPIWFLMIVPPMLFLTLAYNAVMATIGLSIVYLIIKEQKIIERIVPNILKLWGLTILVDVVSFILMILPQLFYKNSFIKENLIQPLETNQYSNILSAIYTFIIAAIVCLIIYSFIKRSILNKYKVKDDKKKLVIFILMLFMFPYIFFLPSNKIVKTEYQSLEELRGTTAKSKSKIGTALKYLETSDNISSYVIDTHAEPYSIDIYVKDIELNHQMLFERDAAILFSIIDDVNQISFYLNDKQYVYTINRINKIFKDVKEKSIVEIYNRYKDTKYTDYIYLGHVGNYDVFDTSEFCETEHQLLFEVTGTEYYLSCSSLDKIIIFNKTERINIEKAMEQGLITQYDILNSTVDLKTDGEFAVENNN